MLAAASGPLTCIHTNRGSTIASSTAHSPCDEMRRAWAREGETRLIQRENLRLQQEKSRMDIEKAKREERDGTTPTGFERGENGGRQFLLRVDEHDVGIGHDVSATGL